LRGCWSWKTRLSSLSPDNRLQDKVSKADRAAAGIAAKPIPPTTPKLRGFANRTNTEKNHEVFVAVVDGDRWFDGRDWHQLPPR